MPERRQSNWLLLTAALIGLPIVYLLSFGPACWLFGCFSGNEAPELPQAYAPVGAAMFYGPEPVREAFDSYGSLAIRRTVVVPVPFDEMRRRMVIGSGIF